MTWTPDLIIGISANLATSIISMALMLIVLGQAPFHINNWLFALVMLLFAVMGGIGLISYFSQPLEFHPRNLVYLATTLYGIDVVLLFIFSARFSGTDRRVGWLLAVGGVIMLLVLVPMLWSGHIYTDFERSENGSHYYYKLASSGVPGLALLGLYLFMSALALFRFSEEHARGLWVGPVILLAGMLLFLVPMFDKFPKNTVAISISSLVMARLVMQQQLFNPMALLNDRLAAANAQLAETNQRLIEANQRLEEASQLKSQFLANMSHELRTPLNSIIGYTELILDNTYGPLTGVQSDRLSKVVRNGRNLLSLINDILDLSKIEAGRLELAIQSINAVDVIDAVLAEFEPMLPEKALTFERNYEGLPRVMADEGRLRQILVNLVSNAVKFTRQGTIRVCGRSDASTGTVRFSVIDTGIGIAESDLAYIFDEFRQVDGTATREYEGTGLGLAITKRLVELHGGTIWVESAVGQGTTFTFMLPLAETIPDAASGSWPDRITPLGAIDTPIAVVIDDSPEAADVIRDTLIAEGFHVLVAHSGTKGIETARRVRPDVITLDIMMPQMNGWDVLRTLKTDPKTALVPVVFVSIVEGQSPDMDVVPDGYISKPIDRARLVRMVRDLVRPLVPREPVLLVEDNPHDRDILLAILERGGLDAIPVAGGQQAVEWLSEHRASLVLLDLRMPGLDGFGVLDAIRTRSAQPDLSVIVVSAKDLSTRERQRLTQYRAIFMPKQDMHPKDLLRQIRALLVQPAPS
jgi:signal transduction histidine kinase/CheY-like chemotaxis protein